MFVWEPVLFGTWDGVFTTCMINIFGVVLFLRTGYLVVSMHTLCCSLYLHFPLSFTGISCKYLETVIISCLIFMYYGLLYYDLWAAVAQEVDQVAH